MQPRLSDGPSPALNQWLRVEGEEPMDCLTFSTPRDALQCAAADARRLTALLQDDGPRVGEDQDDLDHGFTLEHDAPSGQLFIFAEDGHCNPEALPAVFCQALGEIAQRAGVEAIEFGVAQISTRFMMDSHTGYQFRIRQDGRLVYPSLTWPTATFSPVPTLSSTAEAIESSDPLPAVFNTFEVALATADPILAALDAVLRQIQDVPATPCLDPNVRREALDLVIDRLDAILLKVRQIDDFPTSADVH